MNLNNFDPYKFSKREIDGVPIYYKNLPWAPCIYIRVVFNTGAFDDPIGKEGLSHFLEHILLMGCPSLPDKKAIRQWSKINTLNSLNAFTGFDKLFCALKCLPEKYDIVLDGLKDLIFHPYLKPEDIENERKVIMQEAWKRFVNEKLLKYIREFNKIFYWGNQKSRFNSPLGWPETINKISTQDITDWHQKNFGTGNFYIVLAGAVEEKHVDRLKDFLKDLPKIQTQEEDFGKLNKPTQKEIVKTDEEIGEVKEQVEISMYRLLETDSYQNSEISRLYGRLLGDLLTEKLKIEHSLCYNVSVGIGNLKRYSQFNLSVKTEEKNIDQVKKDIEEVVDNIRNKKVIERFDIIKQVYKDQIKSREFLSGEIADSATDEISIYDGHIITQEEQLKYLDKVSYEDILILNNNIFNPEYLLTEIILPSKKSF